MLNVMEGLLKAFWVESNIVYVIVNKGKRAIFQQQKKSKLDTNSRRME